MWLTYGNAGYKLIQNQKVSNKNDGNSWLKSTKMAYNGHIKRSHTLEPHLLH